MMTNSLQAAALRRCPAVFLDRDGTLNVEKEYVCRIEDWEWIPGAQQAIRLLNDAGYKVIVVSNQAGIARGKYGEQDVARLHAHVREELRRAGARIDAFYFCPHHPDFGAVRECGCRKPAPGMLLKAAEEMNIDLARSWLVGDKLIDLQAGHAAHVRSILVRTGYGAEYEAAVDSGQIVVDNVLDACKLILDDRV